MDSSHKAKKIYNKFNFKQFSIQQNNAAMKIGTDGILLGAWTDVNKAKQILDIGCGTGVIGIMQAQKNCEAIIDLVEIDKSACIDANINISNCPWYNRINLFESALDKFNTNKKYDVIISNPPFFNNSLKSENNSRSLARHSISLDYKQIILFSNKYLNNNGGLSLILPYNQADECISFSKNNNLFLSRICNVKAKETKKAHRILLEFSKIEKNLVKDTIIIENNLRHNYTKQYKVLTNNFYTIFD